MKMPKPARIIAAILAASMLAMSLASCSSPNGASASELKGNGNVKSPEEKIITDKFTEGYLEFAFSLFEKTLPDDKKNSNISPLSAMLALAMLQNGAEGNTKAQFEEMFSMTRDELNGYLYTFVNDSLFNGTSDVGSGNTLKATAKVANSLWASNSGNFNVNPDFVDVNSMYYRSSVYSCDFSKRETVDLVNGWVSDNTDGMIKKIVNDFPDNTVMALINTLFFEASWAETYEKYQVKDGIFNAYNGAKENASLMSSMESVYLSSRDACGFVKNYYGGYSFVAVLPDEGKDIYDFAAGFTYDDYLDMMNNRVTNAEVTAKLPKFSFDYSKSLNEPLKAMGLTDVFSKSESDLSGMGSADGNIYLDTALQKTRIELNEYGTRAAAVTILTYATSGLPVYKLQKTVVLDRPFMWFIIDSETSLPLFMGITSSVTE